MHTDNVSVSCLLLVTLVSPSFRTFIGFTLSTKDGLKRTLISHYRQLSSCAHSAVTHDTLMAF